MLAPQPVANALDSADDRQLDHRLRLLRRRIGTAGESLYDQPVVIVGGGGSRPRC